MIYNFKYNLKKCGYMYVNIVNKNIQYGQFLEYQLFKVLNFHLTQEIAYIDNRLVHNGKLLFFKYLNDINIT